MTISARKKIKESAEKIVESYALKAPINVSTVAKSFGIDVMLSDGKEVEDMIRSDAKHITKDFQIANVIGYFDKVSKTFYIPRGANSSIQRQRFTVAHEIGHYVLNHKNNFRVVNKNDIYDFHEQSEEVEANYFASYLLVPDKDLISRISTIKFFKLHELRVSYFAKIFMISVDAMRIRFKTFFEDNPQYA